MNATVERSPVSSGRWHLAILALTVLGGCAPEVTQVSADVPAVKPTPYAEPPLAPPPPRGPKDPLLVPPRPGAPGKLVFRNERLFDGEQVFAQTDVLVTDGMITAVGTLDPMPTDAVVVEGKGKTLLPGLIDAHAHPWTEV